MLNPLPPAAALAMLLAAPAAVPIAFQPAGGAGSQHLVVHVPRIAVAETRVDARRGPRAPVLAERPADDCVRMRQVSGFAVTRPDAVDLVLRDGSRLRARLGARCPAEGFHTGFYTRPHPDGRMCAGRDTIRARSGANCRIERFTTLVPTR